MFTAQERDRVRERLLGLARADSAVTGAALTGSGATGGSDQWSDLDLFLGIRGPLGEALDRWTQWLYRDFGAVHHWDLPAGPAVYRVFLLDGWLEVDLGFSPAADFGPRGPQWRTVFGQPVQTPEPAGPDPAHLAGRAWHHALHARISIERDRYWQAEHWISALRDQVLSLACLRLGLPTSYAKGAHLLPPEVTGPLTDALVRLLAEEELRRALRAAADALAAELGRTDPALAGRLTPMLAELTDG